ncbi:MAG TPA: hypothetical protein VGO31_10370 [Microbacteriaceae bacterium]|nr:hypothetical protein [Microbacteriaceae bacterium]
MRFVSEIELPTSLGGVERQMQLLADLGTRIDNLETGVQRLIAEADRMEFDIERMYVARMVGLLGQYEAYSATQISTTARKEYTELHIMRDRKPIPLERDRRPPVEPLS